MGSPRAILHAGGDVASAIPDLTRLFGGAGEALFVPFAGYDWDGYTDRVTTRLAPAGVRPVGIHTLADPVAAVEAAAAIVVGGGNSFRLLDALQRGGLVEPIRRAVLERGVPYFGSSAGANVGGASIRTTNDMPIVHPASLEAVGLVPLQINPHYVDAPPPELRVGESRPERLLQFLEANDAAVVGLREQSWLRLCDGELRLRGSAGAVLFERGHPPRSLEPEADLTALLSRAARFDVPLPR